MIASAADSEQNSGLGLIADLARNVSEETVVATERSPSFGVRLLRPPYQDWIRQRVSRKTSAQKPGIAAIPKSFDHLARSAHLWSW